MIASRRDLRQSEFAASVRLAPAEEPIELGPRLGVETVLQCETLMRLLASGGLDVDVNLLNVRYERVARDARDGDAADGRPDRIVRRDNRNVSLGSPGITHEALDHGVGRLSRLGKDALYAGPREVWALGRDVSRRVEHDCGLKAPLRVGRDVGDGELQ